MANRSQLTSGKNSLILSGVISISLTDVIMLSGSFASPNEHSELSSKYIEKNNQHSLGERIAITKVKMEHLAIQNKINLILPHSLFRILIQHFLKLLLNFLWKIFPFHIWPFFPIQWKWKSLQYHPIVSNTSILSWAITHCRCFFISL